MKRIAILSDKFPPLPCGGIASAHFSLYKMFKSKGYEVQVFTYLEEEKEIKGIKDELDIHRFGISKFESACLSVLNRVNRKLTKWFFKKKGDKDLAYQLNLVKQANIGSKKINRHLKKFNPDIVFIPDFGVPGYRLKKLPSTLFIHLSHHNPVRYLGNPLLHNHSIPDALAAIRYEQMSLMKIDRVICPSNYMRNKFRETFTFHKDILCIPNMIDSDFIKSTGKYNVHWNLTIDESWPIVYIPSSGSKLKGEKYVIEIIRRISSGLSNRVGFYLSGELSESQKYELSYYKEYHIYSPGKVNLETNISNVKDCTLCVSPTLIECFGMAILEAIFCNLPCVAFDVGGNKEIIDNKNGYLVPYLDIESLIGKSLDILNSPYLLKNMVDNTRATQMEYFSDKIFKDYISLLNC